MHVGSQSTLQVYSTRSNRKPPRCIITTCHCSTFVTQNYIFNLHKIQWGFPAQVQEEQSLSKFENCMLAHNQLCKFTAPGPIGSLRWCSITTCHCSTFVKENHICHLHKIQMGFPRAGSIPAGCAMQRSKTECTAKTKIQENIEHWSQSVQ